MVYYIDPQNGSDSNAGTIPESPGVPSQGASSSQAIRSCSDGEV